jgi:hypothetical protein
MGVESKGKLRDSSPQTIDYCQMDLVTRGVLTMKRSIGLLVLAAAVLAALTSGAFAGGIRDGSLSAFSNGTGIVVRWVSMDERDVEGYLVERKAGTDGPFVQLTFPHLSCRGTGASYEFVDNSAFRVTDNFYQYRVTVVGNGTSYYVTVNHRVSSVRRTWGSIKAMFR